jgi:hypothetical protein
MVEGLKITIGCIGGAIIFGIAYDLATAHYYTPYFTHFHPKLIESQSPLAMALLWGVIATWWVGLFAGIVLSIASQVGSKPPLSSSLVLRRVGITLLIVYMLSMALLLAQMVILRGETGSRISASEFNFHPRFPAVLLVHQFSYLAGFLGIVYQAVSIVRARGSRFASSRTSDSK